MKNTTIIFNLKLTLRHNNNLCNIKNFNNRKFFWILFVFNIMVVLSYEYSKEKLYNKL